MNHALIVLAPSGHRKTIKVEPNTIILKVLERACEKLDFDPNEYDLKHHKRVLDLTTPYRFAGIPNNSLLEMIPAQKKRVDSDVELVVQLENGTRHTKTFKPDTKLANIITDLCADELTDDAFVIYTRSQIPRSEFNETSLKDLGLLGGRALIRLVHRPADMAKCQAQVALNLKPKPKEPKEDIAMEREPKVQKTSDSFNRLIVETLKEEKATEPVPSTSSGITDEPMTSLDTQKSERMEATIDTSSIKTQSQGATEPNSEPMVVDEPEEQEEEEEVGEIHILGERNAVLFTLDAANSSKTADLPDSFFDINVKDIRILLKDLRTESHGTVDQPMLTAKLREMQAEQDQLTKLNRYKTVIIRVQFPNRYVLQGTFTPYETIEKVMEFVRPFLVDADIDFNLYTTPPKNILAKELRLFEAECVPSAVLHFGCENKQLNYLKESILDKVSSPKASLKQASLDRGLKGLANSSTEMSGTSESTATKLQRERVSNSFRTSTSMSTSETNVPKWFKLNK